MSITSLLDDVTLIGRIHGAIVAATGRSDRRGDCRGDRRSPRVYATRDRRDDNRQLVVD